MNTIALVDTAFSARLVLALGHFLWQAAAIALLAVIVTWLCRRASVQVRYAILLAALLLMAACPPVTFSLLKAPQEAPPQPLHDEPITMPVPPDDLHAEQLPAPPTDEAALIITNEADASADKISGSTDAAAPVGSDGVIKEKPAGVNWSSWDYWKRFAPYVTVVYLLGVATMFARLLLALRGGRRLRKISRPVNDAALLATIAAKAGQIGLRFTPAVAYCWQVAVPTVIGVLRPMVLLPVSFATGLSAEQVEAILAHELAHIRRYDYLLNLLQRVIESLLFFHPAVWFISRRIRIERENCCDDMVVSAGGEAYSYAASLVRTAELSLASRSACRLVSAAALGATDKPSQLRLRILRLLGRPQHERTRLSRTWPVALLLITAVLATSVFVSCGKEKKTLVRRRTSHPAAGGQQVGVSHRSI